ncbi:MAG TPA: anthranilate synthase component I family protein [Gaiellaceae bacterium]|nr:anthranilate synthase component I family protein [Gaiellaceae bacterium]
MLEVWRPDDPLAELEAYLGDTGFLGSQEDVVADVLLNYGISRKLRRAPWPDPPEPCRLPLVAARIRPADERPPAPGPFRVGEWRRSWDDEGYAAAIEAVRDAIARGDVYQVNLVQHLRAPFEGDPRGLAPRLAPLRPLHPEPLAGEGWAVVSASPELFLARRGNRVWTKPIKGTRPAGVRGELRLSEKDAAEHVMIVDLERNDLARVCEPGSVRWPDFMAEHELAGVMHMVTTVEGRLRADVGLAELLAAVFPGGSITGAPKISAIDHIAAFEPVGRGASMGALGRIHPNGDLELALTIRTFAVADGEIHLWAGGGIVWDSDPQAEIEESWVKARPLLAAVGSPVHEPVRA